MDNSERTSLLIDRIYALLEDVEHDLTDLKGEADQRKWELHHVPSITDAVEFLSEYGYANRLGLSRGDVAKFDALKGQLSVAVLKRLGERILRLLKELEGEIARETAANQSTEPSTTDGAFSEQSTELAAEQWVLLRRDRNSDLLALLNDLCAEVIHLAKHTNLPEADRALSDLDRAQLIVLLETTLAVLKGPMVEKGLLKRVKKSAEAGVEATARAQTERAFGFAAGKLAEAIGRLLGIL